MAAARIVLLPRAERELAALPDAARERVIAAVEMLADFPHLGIAMVGPFHGYRCLYADASRYRVIYKTPAQNRVEIAWLRHVKRGPAPRPSKG